MKEIVKRDEGRQAEIKIVLNNDDDVVGVEIKLFQPISLVDFNFERIFAPSASTLQARMMNQNFMAAGQPGVLKPK